MPTLSINDEDRNIIVRAIEAARHQPRLIDGTWWMWDFDQGKYIDSKGVASFEESGVLNESLSDMQARIETLESFMNAAPDRFLRKDIEDIAHKMTTFEQGLHSDIVRSRNFSSGLAGSGFRIMHDETGSHLEVDYATFRKKAYFYELVIQQISHQGGIMFFTPARMECSEVQITADGFKCFFDTKSGTVSNDFVVGDQARCQRFDLGLTTAKYYWRLVTEVGKDYIVLSLADADAGSDQPQAGDLIVQLGNRTDPARQAAKVTTVIGHEAPRDEYYEGIDSYDLTGKLITVVGVRDGKVGIFTDYGAFSGAVTIGANSTGLENLAEWADKQSQINQAHERASEAAIMAQDAIDATKKLAETLAGIDNDSIFEVSEKFSLRTEWEKINGRASLVESGSSGSYMATLDMIDRLGYNQGEKIIISYGDFVLTYNGVKIVYNQSGIDAFRLAYETLKEYFVSVRLYENKPTEGFDRQEASRLLTDYYDAQTALLALAQKYHALTASSEAVENFVNTTYKETITRLQESIDKKSETFRQDADPSADWTDQETRALHEGDIWWNTSDQTINGVPAGTTAIYTKSGDAFVWDLQPVPKEVFDYADGKAAIHVVKPSSYHANDLWILENDTVMEGFKAGTMLVASTTSDTFDAAHWTKRDHYTDDTRANEAYALADEAKSAAATAQQSAAAANQQAASASKAAEEAANDAADAQSTADQAQDAADAAGKAAEAAAKNAKEANDALADIASDSKLTPSEKIQTNKTLQEITAEYQPNMDLAGIYSVDSIAYKANYEALIAYLTPLLNDITTTDNIDSDTFADKFEGYYIARTALLNAISAAAKNMADKAQADAEKAQEDAAAAAAAAAAAHAYAEQVAAVANETKALAEALQSSKVGTTEYNKKVAELQELADAAADLASSAQSTADQAQAAADAAATAAATAANTAAAAAKTLSDWSADNVISPIEKNGVRDELTFVTADKDDIDNQKALYLINDEAELYRAYKAAFEAYKADLGAILATSHAVNVPEGMSAHQAAFYAARTNILNAIAAAAKDVADEAQDAADAAGEAAEAAKNLADEAYKYADKLQVLINHLNDDTILDISEKFSLRTEWEKINGTASLVESGSSGSYMTALKTLETLGYNQGEDVVITYNGIVVTYNGARIIYNMTGTEAFRLAYEALKEYFVRIRLYENEPTEGFDRQEAARILSGYYDSRSALLDLAQKYHALTASSEAVENFVNTTYRETIERLQASIDKKSETFRQAADPSVDWKDQETRALHEGDIWWNTSDQTINGVPAGTTAIYTKSGDSFVWDLQPVPKEVFDYADGKAAIHVVKPSSYHAKDLWILENDTVMTGHKAGTMLVASTASDVFNAAHWSKKDRYTDDTRADAAAAAAAAAAELAASAQEAARKAQASADEAQDKADAAAKTLSDWSADNIISPVEKAGVRDELSFITADKTDIDNQRSRYGISANSAECKAYEATYNSYKADLNTILNTSGSVTVPEGMPGHQTAFYTARTAILNAIAAAAKAVADEAQSAADEAAAAADAAQKRADEAYAYAEGLKELLDKINDDSVLDEIEKVSIRTQWEMISGAASLAVPGKNGSYQTALDLAEALGGQLGIPMIITYNGMKITYNGNVITYNISGLDQLKAAYEELKTYLSSVRLYSDEPTEGFDREMFAAMITAYYAAEKFFLATAQAAYTNDQVEDVSSALAENLATSVGYDSFSAMEEAAKAGKTITVGGYINTALIKAKAILADHIAAGAITAEKIAAGAITAEKIAAGAITAEKIAAEAITADKIKSKSLTADQIDLINLFAQFIQAKNMVLQEGCKIANVIITEKGLRIDTSAGGSVYIDEESGISTSAEMTFAAGKQATMASMGGCAGTAMSALAGKAAVGHCLTYNDRAIGLEVGADAQGAAIFCQLGMYAGFRANLRNLGSPAYTEQLNELDNNIIITSGSIVLPYNNLINWDKVPFGHPIRIIHTSSTKLTIDSDIAIRSYNSTSSVYSITSTSAEIIELLYNGTYWIRL